jgi:hypothetical protein
VAWAVAFVQNRHGGWLLLLLSIGMLLVGGGFAPPIIGVLAGLAGTAINVPPRPWHARLSPATWRVLAGVWPWVFGVAVANGLFLVVGSVILVYGFGVNDPELFLASFYVAVLSVPLATVTGIAHDLRYDARAIPT